MAFGAALFALDLILIFEMGSFKNVTSVFSITMPESTRPLPSRETSAAAASLFCGKLEDAHTLDDSLEILAVVFVHEDLPDGKGRCD